MGYFFKGETGSTNLTVGGDISSYYSISNGTRAISGHAIGFSFLMGVGRYIGAIFLF